MVKYEVKKYLSILIFLAIITYALIFYLTQDLTSIDKEKALTHISTTITICSILSLIFIKYLWKWKKLYPWLVPIPDLSGDWIGVIQPNQNNKISELIEAKIKIQQTFFSIQIQMKTKESASNSIGASFDVSPERGIERIIYSYQNNPDTSVRDRSPIHYGTTILNFQGCNVDVLEGEYWTSRISTGSIKLKKQQI